MRPPGQLLMEGVAAQSDIAETDALPATFVAYGEVRLGPDGTPRVEQLVVRRTALATLPLTSREREVMQAAATGATNAEIAAGLCISSATVKKHLEHVYAKLGVHSRSTAVARALSQEIAPGIAHHADGFSA